MSVNLQQIGRLIVTLCAGILLATVVYSKVSYAQAGCPVVRAAVISTAGDSNGKGQLSQSFKVPPGFELIEGRIKFLSNEWPVFFGTEFNDTYLVRITTPAGSSVLASGNLNSSSWSSGASGFNGQTPEIAFSFDLSPFVGQVVTLHFDVRDVGDLVVDSGLAIDGVNIVRTEDFLPVTSGSFVGIGGTISGQMGQGVRLNFTNITVPGTTILVQDLTLPFPSERGPVILLPFLTQSFTFAIFTEEPVFRLFEVATFSDSFIVNYDVESTWVSGMPPNPCF